MLHISCISRVHLYACTSPRAYLVCTSTCAPHLRMHLISCAPLRVHLISRAPHLVCTSPRAPHLVNLYACTAPREPHLMHISCTSTRAPLCVHIYACTSSLVHLRTCNLTSCISTHAPHLVCTSTRAPHLACTSCVHLTS